MEGTKYQNIKNGAVIVVLKTDDVRKTAQVEYVETGRTTDLSMSTIKRWWKPVMDEDDRQLVAEEIATLEKTEIKEELAGDGTPLAEVGKEIAEQAKQKAKAVKKPKKEKRSTANPEVPEIVEFIDSIAKKAGMNCYIRDKQPNLKNYRFDDGKVLFIVRIVRRHVEIHCKSRDLDDKLVKSMQHMNGFYNKKLSIETLEDNKDIITNIIKCYNKKEEK